MLSPFRPLQGRKRKMVLLSLPEDAVMLSLASYLFFFFYGKKF